MRPTVAEISLPQVRENYRAICDAVGPAVAVMAVVKANAYGHGAEEVARALAAEGARWFAVCSAEEGSALRRAGLTQPILLLSGFWPGQEELLAAEHLTPAIFDEEQLVRLNEEGARRGSVLPFHMKVDTGLGRLGLDIRHVDGFLARLRGCRNACLEGLMTHFASADAASPEQSLAQIELFQRALSEVRRAGIEPAILHAAATAALIRFPAARGNMVRPGIGLYGYAAAPVSADSSVSPVALKPVLTLKSRIMSVRDFPAGSTLGYGATYVTSGSARIACVPAGYADGINRMLSNCGRALIHGRPVPMAGRVSMDLTLFDVTGVEGVNVGDEVVFIGRQGEAEITAEQVAQAAGTISYEILCNISPRVPRVYIRE